MINPFPKNLKLLRRMQGYSQSDLARSLELKNQRIVSAYEAGMLDPSAEDIVRISDKFDVDIESLIRKDLREEIADLMGLKNLKHDVEEVLSDLKMLILTTTKCHDVIEGIEEWEKINVRRPLNLSQSEGANDQLNILRFVVDANWTFLQSFRALFYQKKPYPGADLMPSIDTLKIAMPSVLIY